MGAPNSIMLQGGGIIIIRHRRRTHWRFRRADDPLLRPTKIAPRRCAPSATRLRRYRARYRDVRSHVSSPLGAQVGGVYEYRRM